MTKNLQIPGEENVDPGVGGDDDDKREEEDLAVVQGVVDVGPMVRAEISGEDLFLDISEVNRHYHILHSLGHILHSLDISQYIGCTREAQIRPQIWDGSSTREGLAYQEKVSRCRFFLRTTWTALTINNNMCQSGAVSTTGLFSWW